MIETIALVIAFAVSAFVVFAFGTPFDIDISDGPEFDDEGDPR
jgi:hypothetical protein